MKNNAKDTMKRSTTVFLWTGVAVLFVTFNSLFVLFFNCFRKFHLLRRDSERCRFIFHNCIQLLKNILHDLVGQRKIRCHIILFVKLKVHTFKMVWTQSSLVRGLYFLTDETVCISFVEMNVILFVVDIQNIHKNKSMT
ncbi:hypothetical protein CY35_10G046200 [Sphagnum magellanicum]|nr:hypothetical protein CY35_10G046200 [Sphagnum magellanicum]